MTAVKISEDILLRELFDIFPESRQVLMEYGYDRIVELGIEDVVIDKLSLKGFFRLMDVPDEEAGKVIRKIHSLYNKRLEDL